MIDKFIFHPRKNNIYYSRIWKRYKIKLNLNNEILQGWLVKASSFKKSPFILYYGGNAEDISINLGEMQPDKPQPMSWLYVDYRGFGESTGKPSQAGLFADALAIYDYVINELNISPDKIYLMGRSIGSSIAAYVASQRRVAGLILVTPFDSLVSFAPKILNFFPITHYLEKYFNTQKYLENVSGQILLIIAGEEEIIPKSCAINLINKFKDQLQVVEIKNADHQNIYEYAEYDTVINNYIKSNN